MALTAQQYYIFKKKIDCNQNDAHFNFYIFDFRELQYCEILCVVNAMKNTAIELTADCKG